MHRFANPTRFLKLARALTAPLLGLGVAVAGFGLFAGLFWAPADYLQGDLFRILYVHVPTAWLGLGGWSGLTIACLALLIWRHPLAGLAARAIALPGAVFCALCLATGSLWGRPAWGAWWVWDARLTSMAVLFFLYLAFLALAGEEDDDAPGGLSRMAAIFGVVGAINLPIIKYSVEWLDSQHQGPSVTLFGGSTIAWPMLWPLLLSALGFTLIFAAVVLMRMRALMAQSKARARLRRLALA